MKVYDPRGATVNDWAVWGSPWLWNIVQWNSHCGNLKHFSVPAAQPNGIPVEWLVELCNQTNCDGWFSVPITATDDFMTKLGQLLLYGVNENGMPYSRMMEHPVYAPLKPNLHAYIEYDQGSRPDSPVLALGRDYQLSSYDSAYLALAM